MIHVCNMQVELEHTTGLFKGKLFTMYGDLGRFFMQMSVVMHNQGHLECVGLIKVDYVKLCTYNKCQFLCPSCRFLGTSLEVCLMRALINETPG